MGILFGVGTALVALLVILRLLPKMIGLSVWLGSVAVTGGAALAVLYLLDAN